MSSSPILPTSSSFYFPRLTSSNSILSQNSSNSTAHRHRLRRQNSNVFLKFDQKQILEFKEAFSVLDVDGDGYIDKEDLRDILSSLGQTPTEEYIDQMLRDSPTGPSINFPTFLTMMAGKLSGTDPESEILEAFSCLADNEDDEEAGVINADFLREVLTTMGDRLTDEEVDLMLQTASVDEKNNFNYREFCKALKQGQRADT